MTREDRRKYQNDWLRNKYAADPEFRARQALRSKKYRQEHPDASKKRYAENPEKHRQYQRKSFRKRQIADFGFDIWSALEAQGGRCAVCRVRLLTVGDNKSKIHVASLDHDHKTGKARGVLCGRCNIGIGYFLDNPDALRSAAAYLEKFS